MPSFSKRLSTTFSKSKTDKNETPSEAKKTYKYTPEESKEYKEKVVEACNLDPNTPMKFRMVAPSSVYYESSKSFEKGDLIFTRKTIVFCPTSADHVAKQFPRGDIESFALGKSEAEPSLVVRFKDGTDLQVQELDAQDKHQASKVLKHYTKPTSSSKMSSFLSVPGARKKASKKKSLKSPETSAEEDGEEVSLTEMTDYDDDYSVGDVSPRDVDGRTLTTSDSAVTVGATNRVFEDNLTPILDEEEKAKNALVEEELSRGDESMVQEPISSVVSDLKQEKVAKGNSMKWIILAVLVVFLAIFAYFAIGYFVGDGDDIVSDIEHAILGDEVAGEAGELRDVDQEEVAPSSWAKYQSWDFVWDAFSGSEVAEEGLEEIVVEEPIIDADVVEGLAVDPETLEVETAVESEEGTFDFLFNLF